jgi:hypothetical protein
MKLFQNSTPLTPSLPVRGEGGNETAPKPCANGSRSHYPAAAMTSSVNHDR